jgi:hypothetical protein
LSRRSSLKGVLRSFLGTYTSRYSDYEGYWLFGVLETCPRDRCFDLLGPAPEPATKSPETFAARLASRRFSEQLAKSGVGRDCVAHASLVITRQPTPRFGRSYSRLPQARLREGIDYRLKASVTTDLGRTYSEDATVFVAPHDPELELRRRPEQWGT